MEPNRDLPLHGNQDSAAKAESITSGPGAKQGPFDTAPPLPSLPGRLPDAHEPISEGVGFNGGAAPTIRPRVVDELVAYLSREADLETADRVEAGFVERGSEVNRLLDAIGRKAEGLASLPGDTDFGFGYQSSYWQGRSANPSEEIWGDRLIQPYESLPEEEKARCEAEYQELLSQNSIILANTNDDSGEGPVKEASPWGNDAVLPRAGSPEAGGRRSEPSPPTQCWVVEEVISYLRGELERGSAREVEEGFLDENHDVARLFDAIMRRASGEDPHPDDSDLILGHPNSPRRPPIPRAKTWSDRFREANESLTEEEEARHEAEFQALLKSRQDLPGDDQWVDDGPDPFGMDWAWCDGPFDDE